MSTFVTGEGTIANWRWEYAGFGRRLAAYMIDGVVIATVMEALALAGIAESTMFWTPGTFPDRDWTTIALQVLIGTAYFVVLNGLGATPGKRLTGIRVVDAAGQPPGLPKGAIRYALPFVLGLAGLAIPAFIDPDAVDSNVSPFQGVPTSVWGLFLISLLVSLYDHLSMLWHRDRQTLHDRIAGTYVVRRWWG